MPKTALYKYHIIALLTVIVWGTTFVSTKVLINNGLDPANIFLLRFVLAYICILPLSLKRVFAASWQDELTLALAGVAGGSLYFLAENIALQYAPASNVSLIVCTAPLWTALFMSLTDRSERMSKRQIAGSALAFIGMALVVFNGRFVLQISPLGDILAFAAALLWVVYSVVIKRVSGRYSAIFITRKIFFYGLMTIMPVIILQPHSLDMAALVRPVVWGNLLFLGVVASMLCYLLWNIAIHKLGTIRATNYIYFNPLSTIITAAIFIGEEITFVALVGGAMIIYGMWRAR